MEEAVAPSERSVDVRTWLADTCERIAHVLPGVRAWSPIANAVPAAVRFTLGEDAVEIAARAPDDRPSWLARPGVSFNVACAQEPAPREVQVFLRALRAAIEEQPVPALRFPSPPAGPPAAKPRRVSARARNDQSLADRVRRAAFYAWKVMNADPRILPPVLRHDGTTESKWRTLVLQEYYPYVGALGEPTPEGRVREGWADTVARIRAGRAPDRLGLYVHFPFCTTRCRFCYCAVTDNIPQGAMESYVETLIADLRSYGALVDGLPISSVFVGGGTPSLMTREQLERLFDALHGSFHVPGSTQITVETNPDSLTDEKLAVLRDRGRVSRVTIGIQSIDPEAQLRADRFNKPARIRALTEAAHARGILVNMDVIAGMDGQSFEAFQRDVEFALSLRPDSLHLSGFRPVHAERSEHDAEQLARRQKMLAWGLAALGDRGIEPRLAMPPSRDEAAINAQIVEWRDHNASLVGVGVSAYGHAYANSFYETSRGYETTAGIDASLVQIQRRDRTYYVVPSDDDEEMHRFLLHNFQDGWSSAHFRSLFGCDPWERVPERWQDLLELGALGVEGDQVVAHVDTQAEKMIFGVFLYSAATLERIERRWGREYDAGVDYESLVREICAGSG